MDASWHNRRRDGERVYHKMSAEEEVDFKWKMTEINKVGADDRQSPTPSLTPL
jgi:hypothetical protein